MTAKWCREYGLYALMLLAVLLIQSVFDFGLESLGELSGRAPRLPGPEIPMIPDMSGRGPAMVLALTLGFVLVAGLGLTADIVFFMKWLLAKSRGKPLLRLGQNPPGVWVLSDLLKLFVIFFFTVTALHAVLYMAVASRWFSREVIQTLGMFLPTFCVYAVIGATLFSWKRQRGLQLAVPAPQSKSRWRDIGLGLSAYIAFVPPLMVLLLLSVMVCRALGIEPQPHALVELLAQKQSLLRLIGLGVLTVFLGPVMEEIVFRGVAFTALRERWGLWAAAAGSALLFAFAHGNAAQGLPIFGMGMVLALLYEHTGSLTASMTFHVINNTMALALTLLVLNGMG